MTEITREKRIEYLREMMDELRGIRSHHERYSSLCKAAGYDNNISKIDKRIEKLIQDTSTEITWQDIPVSQQDDEDEDVGDSSGFGLHTDMILGENPDMLRQD